MAPKSGSSDADDREEVRAISQRLRAAVEAAGGNKRVADQSGVPLRTLNSYLSAAADPKVTKLHRLAEACGTTVDVLLGRKPPAVSAGSSISPVQGGADIVIVPRLEIRASAGRGRAVVPVEADAQGFAFQRAWLRSLNITPGNAEFVLAEGDSMEPTIKDGDMMLVDRGYGDVVNGKIYILVVDGLVLVKRINKLASGGLMLISDNELYPNETIAASDMASSTIEARVAWYGRVI